MSITVNAFFLKNKLFSLPNSVYSVTRWSTLSVCSKRLDMIINKSKGTVNFKRQNSVSSLLLVFVLCF